MVAPVVLPRLARRFVEKGGDPSRWPERLGHEAEARPGGPIVWVHAVSVGEMASALPLIEAMLAARQDITVLLTTTTASAGAIASNRLPSGAIHRYAPLDMLELVVRFLDHWRPERVIFLESEIWPVQILELARRNIPFALASARLTERTVGRWSRYAPRLARETFSKMSLVLAQDERSAERARALGAPRVEVGGSLKAAAGPLPVDPALREDLARALGHRRLWVAASTHPGEEPIVAEAHRQVLASHPHALCILAPRHADRGAAIAQALAGFRTVRRSTGALPQDDTQIYLADTLGEMGLWYDLAEIAFLGGSLVPGIGGHNPLEPAAFGCAILTGPHTANTEGEFDRLGAAGAAARVGSAAELAKTVVRLFAGAGAEMGRIARRTVTDHGLAERVAAACLAL